MKICENGKIKEVEIAIEEFDDFETPEKVISLAEGLSSAKTLAEVREAAKNVLNGGSEE